MEAPIASLATKSNGTTAEVWLRCGRSQVRVWQEHDGRCFAMESPMPRPLTWDCAAQTLVVKPENQAEHDSGAGA